MILSRVGDRGISVRSLAKHVYNHSRTFFSAPDYKQVHSYVQQYLLRNSKSPQDIIARTGRRGYYCLNTLRSAEARQLVMGFKAKAGNDVDSNGPEAEGKPAQDYSLDLFA